VRTRALAVTAAAGLIAGTLATATAATAAPPGQAPGLPPAAAASPTPVHEDGRYIVLLDDLPTAAYDGRIAGFGATKPGVGEQFDALSAAAQRYDDRLEQRQDDVLADAGVPESDVSADFTTVTNGVAVQLTGAEAVRLAKDPDVLSVTKDELLQPTTSESPDLLGLTGEDGLWAALGGVGSEGAGSDTVIGVIDSGIWPESRSFRAFEDDPATRAQTADRLGFTGVCDAGDDDTFADACNNKLIGARYYAEGFGARNVADSEYLSPRDSSGHGTHTASTAAGRFTEDVESEGRQYGSVSGMAPGARIAAYKACWNGQPDVGSGCAASDLVSAVNAAVADGVDAINYSIGGGSESAYTDPVEIAFLNAAIANVFVATSAGNSGPGASTLDHPSPWLTTVAASTHTILESTLELGDGQTFIGASQTAGIGQTPTVLAVESAAEGVDPADAQQCFPDSLDPEVVTGKVVVCDRGVFARVEKSINVRDAGGVGLVLVNPEESSVNADNHVIPSIHLDVDAYDPVYAYVRDNAAATAAILAGVAEGSDTQVPEVGAFSSRGPSTRADGDILKPDISAPGVDVLAAVSPPGSYGRDYDFMSGTSMSAPHIAGLSLLLREQHPDWTPMEIKSAMMTTADDHVSTTDVFEQGAGFVDPPEFGDPGLVYPSDIDDWTDFLLGQGVDVGYSGAQPTDASDLNQASIAIGELAGEQTVRRTVRNVGGNVALYHAEVSGMEGIDVSVRPEQLAVAAGSTASFDVTFSYDGAPFGQAAQGSLTWVSGNTEVRSPMVVNPVSVSAPTDVEGAGSEGSLTYDVTSGATATIDLSANGLTPGTEEAGTLRPGEVALTPEGNRSTAVYRYEVPEGTTLARFDLDALDDSHDFDLYVVNPEFDAIVGLSASGAADERVDLLDPEPGNYYVLVGAFSTTGGRPGDFVLTSYAVQGPEGNMAVDPASVDAQRGKTFPVTVSWTGLEPRPYLGWVGYSGSEQPTVVSIDGAGEGGTDPGPGPPDDPEPAAVELTATAPETVRANRRFESEVRVVNPGETDLGTADWMLTLDGAQDLAPRDVRVDLLTDDGRERVGLRRGEGGVLTGTVAAGVAVPAGADLVFELRMRVRPAGELTITHHLVGEQVDATATSTVDVVKRGA
jgi:hypothetical protein